MNFILSEIHECCAMLVHGLAWRPGEGVLIHGGRFSWVQCIVCAVGKGDERSWVIGGFLYCC